jgi:lysophospholipase L1-like esterase
MLGPILGGISRIKIGANLNLVCDGNSLTAGAGDSTAYPWPSGLQEQYPEFATSTIRNVAVSGHTTQQMMSHGADAYWVDGKVNVLVAWEGTNSICNAGRAAAQAIQDMSDYVAARRAAHPGWIILGGTVLPRQTDLGQAQTTSQNAVIDAYNDLLRAQCRSMGMKALFDVRRSGSNFNLPDYNNATFEAALSAYGLLASNEVGNHIHLSGAGYAYLMSNFIVPALKRLPAR